MLSRTALGAVEEINTLEVKGETEPAANGVFHQSRGMLRTPKSVCLSGRKTRLLEGPGRGKLQRAMRDK